MALSKVKAGWSEGHLLFKDRASNATIMTIKDGTDGVYFNQDVEVTPQYVKGAAFTIIKGPYAYATFPVCLFVAPAACKVIRAFEHHIVGGNDTGGVTLSKQGGVLTLAQGTNCMATTFNVSASMASYTVQFMAVTNSTGITTLAAGERIGASIDAGADGLTGCTLGLVMEWL